VPDECYLEAMPRRVEDWLRQAQKDLQHSRNSIASQDYEWACFAAQQAAEKALKALYQHLGGEFFGHSLLKMIRELPSESQSGEGLQTRAADLDKLYIPTRYPNGFDAGAPADYFTAVDATKAVDDAEVIIEFVRSKVSR
jgi:HEPN domain-containing protein